MKKRVLISEIRQINGKDYLFQEKACPICDGTKYCPTFSTDDLDTGLTRVPCTFCDIDGIYMSIVSASICINCED